MFVAGRACRRRAGVNMAMFAFADDRRPGPAPAGTSCLTYRPDGTRRRPWSGEPEFGGDPLSKLAPFFPSATGCPSSSSPPGSPPLPLRGIGGEPLRRWRPSRPPCVQRRAAHLSRFVFERHDLRLGPSKTKRSVGRGVRLGAIVVEPSPRRSRENRLPKTGSWR